MLCVRQDILSRKHLYYCGCIACGAATTLMIYGISDHDVDFASNKMSWYAHYLRVLIERLSEESRAKNIYRYYNTGKCKFCPLVLSPDILAISIHM